MIFCNGAQLAGFQLQLCSEPMKQNTMLVLLSTENEK